MTADDLQVLPAHFEKIRDYAIQHFKQLKSRADIAETVTYSTASVGLGQLYPPIRRRICKSQYGRKRRTCPVHLKDYTIYEFTKDMHPLRIRHMADGVCAETFYFFPYENTVYAVPFMGDTDRYFVAVDIFQFTYQQSELVQFGYFNSHRVHMLEFDRTAQPHIVLHQHDYLRKLFGDEVQYQKRTWEYDEGANESITNLQRRT